MSKKTLVQKRKVSRSLSDEEIPGKKMKKKKVKGEKRKKRAPGKPRTPRKGTITEAVLELLAQNPHASSQEIRAALVKKFPKTKFGKAHLAWYKYQVRHGNLQLPHGKVLPEARKGRPKDAEEAPKKKKKGKKKRSRE